MYIGLHVKYRYCCQILMKFEFSGQSFLKYSNLKFHEHPSSFHADGQIDGRRDKHRQTDRTKSIVAFRNSAKARQI